MPSSIPPARPTTSWQHVEAWYDKSVGAGGHYYHKRIILPNTLRLLRLEEVSDPSLIDLACGPGILGRRLGSKIYYQGVDIAPDLIAAAKRKDPAPEHHYLVADVTRPLPLAKRNFTHATIILSLQNIEFPDKALENAALHLIPKGRLVVVLNHPCFRIPRQSGWGIEAHNKMMFRRMNLYMSSLKIPIRIHPSLGKRSPLTLSFHHPLSAYSLRLHAAGFAIELLEEWVSDKLSEGRNAGMENRSRKEFPLFLALAAVKLG